MPQLLIKLPESQERLDTFEILHWALQFSQEHRGREFAENQLEKLAETTKGSKQAVLSSILRYRISNIESDLDEIKRQTDDLEVNYHSMGWAGRVLMRSGLTAVVDACLDKSITAAPETFLHRQFVRDVYFYAGEWEKASFNLERALAHVPYVRPVQARYAFSRLPSSVKESGIFSTAREMDMVFQQNEEFYSNIIPTSKPIFQFIGR